MAEGRVVGEPISTAYHLMLEDVLHFPKAPLADNQTRGYKVVELKANDYGNLTVVEAQTGSRFHYELTDAKLVELGAELDVNPRMGEVSRHR
jgi:hypothetical protein